MTPSMSFIAISSLPRSMRKPDKTGPSTKIHHGPDTALSINPSPFGDGRATILVRWLHTIMHFHRRRDSLD